MRSATATTFPGSHTAALMDGYSSNDDTMSDLYLRRERMSQHGANVLPFAPLCTSTPSSTSRRDRLLPRSGAKLHWRDVAYASPLKAPYMPDSIHNDDTLLRSMERLPVIRAQLASRSWPHLSALSVSERDLVLTDMALREYRAEQLALSVK